MDADSQKKKSNINKKKLDYIKFKKGQSPYEVYSYVQTLKKFVEYKDSIQFPLIDEILENFEKRPRNVKALVKQLGIYSRLIECQQKRDGLKQVKRPTTQELANGT